MRFPNAQQRQKFRVYCLPIFGSNGVNRYFSMMEDVVQKRHVLSGFHGRKNRDLPIKRAEHSLLEPLRFRFHKPKLIHNEYAVRPGGFKIAHAQSIKCRKVNRVRFSVAHARKVFLRAAARRLRLSRRVNVNGVIRPAIISS